MLFTEEEICGGERELDGKKNSEFHLVWGECAMCYVLGIVPKAESEERSGLRDKTFLYM